jgi:hypothetical protein
MKRVRGNDINQYEVPKNKNRVNNDNFLHDSSRTGIINHKRLIK